METLSTIDPMIWMIVVSAAIICVLVIFVKAIKLTLKLAVIAVIFLFVAYLLHQAGIIQLP